MAVRFFYVDESYDQDKFCLSAIAIRHSVWNECFEEIRAHRLRLKSEQGIFLRTELHASDFVHGRGRIGAKRVTKWERSRIFLGVLKLVARLPERLLFNVCLRNKGIADAQMLAWDRLTNRIERTMKKMEETELPKRDRLSALVRDDAAKDTSTITSDDAEEVENRLMNYRARAFIIADEGREGEITAAIRRKHVFNPVPSRYGAWSSGERTQNITADRIIEDPVFKESHKSYFLQLADFVAFALLKREVPPTALVSRYGLHTMFDDALADVCYHRASSGDPLGIVRT